MKIKQAKTLNDLISAFSLLYHIYLTKQFIKENIAKLWFTKQHLDPHTTVWIGEINQDTVITLSIFSTHSQYHIPSFEEFPDIISDLMARHPHLIEIGCLASKKTSYTLLNKFIAAIYQSLTRSDNPPQIIICCHPKHKSYYEKVWNFIPISETKPISRVNNSPGLLMLTNIDSSKLPQSIQELVDNSKNIIINNHQSCPKYLSDYDYENLQQIYKMITN